jgi:hypothetical protein
MKVSRHNSAWLRLPFEYREHVKVDTSVGDNYYLGRKLLITISCNCVLWQSEICIYSIREFAMQYHSILMPRIVPYDCMTLNSSVVRATESLASKTLFNVFFVVAAPFTR